MANNDHARLPSVNKTMFDKGNWQAFTAVVKYIDLFDKANCPASSQCKSHDAGATNLAERGLWRSTQTIHEPTALNTADPRDV